MCGITLLYLMIYLQFITNITPIVHVVKAIRLQHLRLCCWTSLLIHLAISFFSSPLFRAMSVIIYMVFLFIVVIVLLNVLIAQVSDTYGKVLSTAEGIYLYHQCRYIARLEAQQFYPGVICYLLPRCFERCGGACFRRCGFDRFPTCLQICCLISCIIPLCFYYCCDVCFPRCKFDNIVSYITTVLLH